MMTREQAEKIAEKVLGASSADDVRLSIGGGASANVRFARNTISTSGATINDAASVTCSFGNRSGSYGFNQFDDATIAEAVGKAEALAKVAPEDPEYLPPIGAQTHPAVTADYDSTTGLKPESRASMVADCIKLSKEREVVSAGFIENESGYSFIADSKGLRGWHKSGSITYSVTARSKDETGSGWAAGGHNDASRFDALAVSQRAIGKAAASVAPKEVAPGKYTVVLEAQAVQDLLETFGFRTDARSADEGRSYFSDAGGKNRIGQKLFPDFVDITSDPSNADAPGFPWSEDGLPSRRTAWVEKGVLKNLRYSRYWAKEKKVEPVPFGSNLLMAGGTASLDELIASTERGILVTRFWYIRDVDPKTMLLTGLTRDGTFLIEGGKIAHPVKNFRFNESPVAMLKNIETLGKAERLQDGRSANLIPSLKVRDFTFSSLSDAV